MGDQQARTAVEAFVTAPKGLLVEGVWRPALSGATFEVTDPGTGRVIGEVAAGDARDIDQAVASARGAFEDERWRGIPAPERAAILWKVADLLEDHAEEIALLESLDQGMQLRIARAGAVGGAAACFRYYAGWVDKLHGQTSEVNGPMGRFHAYTLLEPVGVVGMIVPWNVPLLVAAWKIAPALAAGCTGVLKPAEETPLSALRLGQVLLDAGVPPGVINVVTGYGDTAGAALTEHPDVDKIAFTGSTEVGRRIVTAAAGNMKRLTLELGGKSPVVIFDDADLDQAIAGAASAIFGNAGQVCSAGSRLFVAEPHFDQVVDGVAEIGKTMKVGYGPDDQSDIGPLISAKQLDTVTGYIDGGVADGAEILSGGRRIGETGYFMEPTVMVKVRPEMRMVREEIFGPVVAAHPFDDLDDVAKLANDTTYGLAASIWTRDIAKAHGLARKIRAGRVGLNVHTIGDYSMPSGGFKASGWGREHGPDGIRAYLETKSVYTKL